ncbi:mannose-1-phosphate guanylyltransferase [Sphingopyxis sp.]|uniref:mannose-1-phosphate guanylyltransferase n=1 Tax=Sphingopyxis sp. TaxID=1908224 RepID=UPI001E11C0BD|nr:sugar phosphate nucleotidyltransferase [Sphingopyxis sp.]MBW8295469.1 NTP transferase domain-containing protein [Sphingopyxis sp.]
MSDLIQPVILCGGAGTRLWPASRGMRAKQFLPLTGAQSLFSQTLTRVAGAGYAEPLIICGPGHVDVAREQAGDQTMRLVVEPEPRNTAAAIALAVAACAPEQLLLVMPSDHIIADTAAFHRAIEQGSSLARGGWLVTFGVAPDRPDTGFGYIANGAALGDDGYAVARFVEKPPLAQAEAMLAAGGFSWNAGIFLFRADAMYAAMARHCRAILAAAEQAMANATTDGEAQFVHAPSFKTAPSVSIDCAVMEKHDRVAVVPISVGWSDLGSWHAVHAASNRDEAGNSASGNSFLHDSRGCLVRGGDQRVSLIGMQDVAVIVDGDDILVMPLARSQDARVAARAHE